VAVEATTTEKSQFAKSSIKIFCARKTVPIAAINSATMDGLVVNVFPNRMVVKSGSTRQ
jgi:hypothetical protein